MPPSTMARQPSAKPPSCASRLTHKKTFLIPENISWEKKSVLNNYTHGAGLTIREIPYDPQTGTCTTDVLAKHLSNRHRRHLHRKP